MLITALDKKIYILSQQLRKKATEIGYKKIFATAESCTGGMIASAITSVAGSSKYFDRGFITYSNKAKTDMLGVSISTLESSGAVSKASVTEMALGAIYNSDANIGVAVTGIAGPSGGNNKKPVGIVFIAIAIPKLYKDIDQTTINNSKDFLSEYLVTDADIEMKVYVRQFLFNGDRNQIRQKSCIEALELMLATF